MSDQLLQRLAALETELSQLRAKNKPEPDFDKVQFLQDPHGYLSKKLTPQELFHVQRVNLAHAMGDQAPEGLRILSQLGPQVAQTSALQSTVESLSRRFDELMTGKQQEVTRESLKTLAANKEKYPHLASAIKANPALLDSRTSGRQGTAEEIAQQLEDEAKAYGIKPEPAQPASDDADKQKEAQSMQSKPAPLAGSMNTPPPLPPPAKPGAWTPEEAARVKQELIRKYNLAEPQAPVQRQ